LVSIHPYAQLAAQASEVAAEQGKFWEYHDLLFEKQPEWAKLSSASQVEDKFVEYAGQLGIDTAKFRERIAADEIRQKVLTDVADSQELNLSGTPSLFVNNTRVPAPGQLLTTVQSLLESQE
jgi:protein-disulfide isomerase